MQPATTIYTIQLAIAIPQPQYSLTHLLYVPLSAPFSQISATWTLYWEILRTHPFIPPTHTLPHQFESIQTGTVLSPVPTSLVEKIESGAFIKMGDLIPTRLGLDDTVCSKLRHSITNITEWLQAFTVYISVIAKTQPHRISDLMGYQILILEASNEYCNDCWLGYDQRFQQQAASHSHFILFPVHIQSRHYQYSSQSSLLSLPSQPKQK